MSHHALRYSIAAAILLQACAAPPPRQLAVRPAMQVTHASNETAEAFYQLGRQHHLAGDLDVAMTGYTYAIARDPRHLQARSAAAAIHAQQGRLEQARALMLAVLADYPEQPQALANLGYIDYLRGEHASAVKSLRLALQRDPGSERARNNLRLAEAGLAARMQEVLAEPQLAAAPAPAPAPAPALLLTLPGIAVPPAVHPSALELVQVVPNIYELRRPAEPVAPAPQQVAQTAPAAPVQPQAASGVRVLVEVSNGDGTAGLARRVGAMFGQHGVKVNRLTNLRPFGLRSTRIEYRAGHQAQAESMRKLMEGPVQLAQVQSGYADVKVVLGRDTQRALALRDANSAAKLATR